MTTLYLAWRDPGRRWYPVGKLERTDAGFSFSYLHGAQIAAEEAGFEPLVSFPDFLSRYSSSTLFPMFANRIPSQTRDEYPGFVTWLNLDPSEATPLTLLGRSAGRRETDTFELFACPKPVAGRYSIHAFIHGLRHQGAETIERAAQLQPGEKLTIQHEQSNPHDDLAIKAHTADGQYHLGYLPRYLAPDVHRLGIGNVAVHVEQVNPPPAPVQYRVLVCVSAPWPGDFEPCSGPGFAAITPEAAAK